MALAESRCASTRGFSVVEVLVATAIMASALVGLAQLFLISTRANMSARTATMASVLAQQKMEQLRGLAWTFNAAGQAVSDFAANLTVVPERPGGGVGLSASPAGALGANTAGYVDYLDRTGNWVGTGAQPVPGTVYIRRWSITPVPMDPNNLIVLQVRVLHVNGRAAAPRDGARLPDDSHVVCLRARRAS